MPIAGPAPISAATSAMTGVRSASNPTKPSGFIGGVTAGYNFQSGSWVFGVEGDIQAAGADDTFAPWKFSNPWFGTVRGRAGYTVSNVLFYGTAGLAFGELRGETFGLSEIPHQRRLDRGRRRRGRPRTALEREDRISLRRPLRQSVRNYRGVKWLPVQHRQGRRELSFLIANKKTGRWTHKLPATAVAGIFLFRTVHAGKRRPPYGSRFAKTKTPQIRKLRIESPG